MVYALVYVYIYIYRERDIHLLLRRWLCLGIRYLLLPEMQDVSLASSTLGTSHAFRVSDFQKIHCKRFKRVLPSTAALVKLALQFAGERMAVSGKLAEVIELIPLAEGLRKLCGSALLGLAFWSVGLRRRLQNIAEGISQKV